MKRIIVLLLSVLLMFGFSITAYATASEDEIIYRYNNVSDVNTNFVISTSGLATVKNTYTGSIGYFQSAKVTTKVQKKVGIIWVTVSGGSWTDKLTAVDNDGLTYDANGNVLTYGDRNFTWSAGRNLASVTEGTDSYSYTYDEDGIRTSKTVNGVTTYYNTRDGVILSQTDGTNTMVFEYDNFGAPIGVVFNGLQYFYITNQVGDVVEIVDENGENIAEYIYDEWGAIHDVAFFNNGYSNQNETLAYSNPLLYRGYYYDYETGYYYLQSRYYDPSICRFINADIPEIAQQSKDEVNGLNLFAYCCNDPVNRVDYDGYKYSAGQAKTYAKKYWAKPGNYSNYIYYEGKNKSDCANFVSQCLFAGGLSKMIYNGSNKWYYTPDLVYYQPTPIGQPPAPRVVLHADYSPSWTLVKDLYKWLKNNHHIKDSYTVDNKKDLNSVCQKLLDKSRCCAVVFFKPDGKDNFSHVAMSGMIKSYYDKKDKKYYYDMYYYAHSESRAGDDRKYDDKTYSLLSGMKSSEKYSYKICILK